MKAVKATDFRNSFHKIADEVEVTSLGRVIGVWSPSWIKPQEPKLLETLPPKPRKNLLAKPKDVLEKIDRLGDADVL